MFSCCIRRKKEGSSFRQVLEVERIVEDFVWDEFLTFNGRRRCCLKRSNFEVEVPMKYLSFHVISQKVTNIPDSVDSVENTRTGVGRTPQGNGDTVELKTIFHNATENEQTYQFTLEKTRKSALTITVQKGFSLGSNGNFGIKQGPATANVGFTLTYSSTQTSGENIEETTLFATSSNFKVDKNSKCEAKVIMDEVKVNCNFKMKILMSLVTEGIPVTIKRKKDGKTFYTYTINDIGRVFKPFESDGLVDPYPDVKALLEMEVSKGNRNPVLSRLLEKDKSRPYPGLVGDRVLFTVSGSVQGFRLSDQRITLEAFRLPEKSQAGESDGKQVPDATDDQDDKQ